MSDLRTRPAKKTEPEESMREFFEMLSPNERDAGRYLSHLVTTMFNRSLEAAAPSMLKLGRRLSEEPFSTRKHFFEQVTTENPWHVAFVAREELKGAGYLFVIELDKVKTPEAEAREQAEFAKFYSIEDPQERLRAISERLIGDILQEEKTLTLTSDFLDPALVSSVDLVKVYAFADDEGNKPAAYSDTAPTLAKVLESVSEGKWSHGTVGEFRPTKDHLELEPSDSSNRIMSVSGALAALNALSDGFHALGLDNEVKSRGDIVAGWSYIHFGEDKDVRLAEEAQGAVYSDSGIAGPISFDVTWEFWKNVTEVDLSARAEQIAEVIDMLKEHGFTSLDNQYECNDMDDFGHVAMDGPKTGTLWVRTQNGHYGVRFADSGGHLTKLVMARVSEADFGRAPLVIAQEGGGFLGSFDAVQAEGKWVPRFVTSRIGRFHDRTIRNINNVLLTLESMHCCLEEDLASERVRKL